MNIKKTNSGIPLVAKFAKNLILMSDNKKDIGKPDRDRIDVSEPYELEYWKKRLGVTSEKLKKAIQKVGPMAKDVEAFLAER